MSTTIAASLFGPLGKNYCSYFYYVSAFSFLLLIMAILSFIYMVLFSKVRSSFMMINGLTTIFTLFMGYFTNRLLYTMCQGSIK